jgi:hypothetical protein
MLATLTLTICGFLLIGYAFTSIFRRRRLFVGSFNGFIGTLLALTGGFASLLLMNVQTYQQLTREITLAEVTIIQTQGPGSEIQLTTQQGNKRYNIDAPEWRLDARFLKWKPWLALFGKDPIVRLERLEARGTPGDLSVQGYPLHSNNQWLDEFISELSGQVGLVDSVYGSSVYMPMRVGAKYEITATVSGLLARPLNQTARGAVLEWSQP